MPLDALTLRGLNRTERDEVVIALAGLLLEAADVAVMEDDDGRL